MLNYLKYFIKNNIDDNFVVMRLVNKKMIPLYLRNKYNFYEITILGQSCILLEIIDESPTINSLIKNIATIQKYIPKQVVIYFKELSSYRRKSLITNRISFIDEQGQFFLTFFGLLINNNSKNMNEMLSSEIDAQKYLKKISFNSITQLAFLYFLYNEKVSITNNDFAKIFSTSSMNASRALKGLYYNNLVDYKITGKTSRSKIYNMISNDKYYMKGMDHLINPIKKIVYVKDIPENSYIAGLEALSKTSMLNPTIYKVRAISSNHFKEQNIKVIINEDIIKDSNLVKLEIWKYDPKYFVKNNIVDILSLYLTLKESKDERIEKEIKQLLRKESWYME
jgi:hypothetical protein